MKAFKVDNDLWSSATESAFDEAENYMSLHPESFCLTEIMIQDRTVNRIYVFDKIEGGMIIAVIKPKLLLKAYKDKKFSASEILQIRDKLQALIS